MAPSKPFSPELVAKIKGAIRKALSARHIPALLLETKDIPVRERTAHIRYQSWPVTLSHSWRLFNLSSCSTPSAGRRWRWQWSRWLPGGRWRRGEPSPIPIHWTFTKTFLNCRTFSPEASRRVRERWTAWWENFFFFLSSFGVYTCSETNEKYMREKNTQTKKDKGTWQKWYKNPLESFIKTDRRPVRSGRQESPLAS